MVLSTLADFIYNMFLLLYYILKTLAFVGSKLFDITLHVSSAVYWFIKNANVFFTVVYEDNHYYIQDVKSTACGTANFFINNIASVYSVCRTIGGTFVHSVIALVTLPSRIFEGFKVVLVLVGEAVWFVFTLPAQLASLLWDIAETLKYAALANITECGHSLEAYVHYIIHDVPLKVVCGLGLLVVVYCYSTHSNGYHQLRILMRKVYPWLHFYYDRIRTIIRHYRESTSDDHRRATLYRLCTAIHVYTAVVYDTKIQPMLTSIWAMFSIRSTNEQKHNVDPTTTGLCIICEDNDRSIAFVPCGHFCVCKRCSIHLCYYNPVCPVCRSHIQQKLEIYT